jgi:hypothetical protein
LSRTERALSIVLAAVFAAAGILKILDPMSFAASIARLRLLPDWMVGATAIVLPWIELVAAGALFVPLYRAAATRLLLGLLAAFTTLLGIGLWMGSPDSCGCFGGVAVLNRADLGVVRNLVLLILVAILLRRKPTDPEGPASPASDTSR